jgi:hypothetical protein
MAAAFSLGPLVSEIGRDQIIHRQAHRFVHRNLDFAKAARLPTKQHFSKGRSREGVQSR